MYKRLLAAVLAALCLLSATAAAAEGASADPTPTAVLVDGEAKEFRSYLIQNNNYFKLRDLAYVLSGTKKQFEVTWDEAVRAISITPGKPYTPVGGEMDGADTARRAAQRSTAAILLNGKSVDLTAYNIAGNNYFKLRDLGKALDFYVGWDGKQVYIDSGRGYDYESEAAQEPAAQALVPVDQLANLSSLKKKMTQQELEAAYAVAAEIVGKYAGMSREEQLKGIFAELRYLTDTELTYSTSEAHYNDPYGFFVLHVASCAGATRAVGLCLNILGIPYEHVNENQWSHQWCRVEVDGTYWICDAYGYYVGPEPGPYEHPYL